MTQSQAIIQHAWREHRTSRHKHSQLIFPERKHTIPMNGSDLRVRDDVEQRFPNSTKQESTMAFFPLDSSLWDSGDNTSTLSPHQTFSSTIWDIPGLELDSAVNMMPTLSYESSFDDPQTSSNATYQLEADWSDSPPPTTRSRLQSEECEENMRKEVRTSCLLILCQSADLDAEETRAKPTGAASLSNEERPPDYRDGERIKSTTGGLSAA